MPPHVGAQEKSEGAHQKKFRHCAPHLQIASDATGLRPSVLGQDRSETKKSVLVLHAVVLILVLVFQVWCCFVKHDLVTLVSI